MVPQVFDLPTVEYLRLRLAYNPKTGHLTWRKRARGVRFKSRAGAVSDPDTGRRKIKIDRRSYQESRIIWCIVYGYWPDPGIEVDHKDMDPSNNRIDNLRLATKSEQTANTKARSSNKSGYKGVSWDKSVGRWRAQIVVKGKQHYLGVHKTAKEAHAAYCEGAKKFRGDFARG